MQTSSPLSRLSLLETKFLNWRKKKRPGEQIPFNLWNEALDLCNHIKYCKVANKLGIGHGDLKRRLMLRNSTLPLVKQETQKPIFQEVSPLAVEALFSSQAVEIISPTGHILRLPTVDPLQAIDLFLKL